MAVEQENIELLMMLLRYRANPNLANSVGQTPLLEAVSRGNLEIIELLLSHGADLNVVSDAGWTAIDIAIQRMKPRTRNSQWNQSYAPFVQSLFEPRGRPAVYTDADIAAVHRFAGNR